MPGAVAERVSSESSSKAAALQRWLVHQALLATPIPRVAGHFVDSLVDMGMPVWRAFLATSTLHPQIEGVGLTWTRDGQRLRQEYQHGSFERVPSLGPMYDAVVATQGRPSADANAISSVITPMTRYRLDRGEGTATYAILEEFRAGGATDYLCFAIPFANGGNVDEGNAGAVVSVMVDRPGGFTDEEVATIADLMPALGAALRSSTDLAAIRTALDTYLGRDVGRRVLNGEIKRGSVEAISAAILVGDLRGFTVLADEVPRDRLVSMLDDYLDCLVSPVEASGGQVLKFLGDGLLATFAFDAHEPRTMCVAALAAATEALRRIDELNRNRNDEGQPIMTLDLALHAGDVLYGNVGSARRLDFTIVGPAVNESARLEALCATLDVPLVASRRFVDLLGTPEKFHSLGPRVLRGVRAPVEVFTLVTGTQVRVESANAEVGAHDV